MNSRTLSKYGFSNNRFIGCDSYSRIGFNDTTHFVYHVFGNSGCCFYVIMQHGYNTGEGCISCSFAQPVYGTMHALYSG